MTSNPGQACVEHERGSSFSGWNDPAEAGPKATLEGIDMTAAKAERVYRRLVVVADPRRKSLQRNRVRVRTRIRFQRRKAMATDIKYEIILYWSKEDQAFLAEVPELPGCAADGATYQEAVANVEGVIREWLETAQE